MTTLDSFIGRLFYKSGLITSSNINGGMAHLNLVWKIDSVENTFTIPRLMLEKLNKLSYIQNLQNSELVMPLRFQMPSISYPETIREFKTLNTFFRNLSELMYNTRLVKCMVEKDIYYVGNDLILNSDFIPIITLGYEIKYLDTDEKYTVASKIIFISPLVYSEYNKMSRFLCNKFIPAFLSTESLTFPIRRPDTNFWKSDLRRADNVKVIVDKLETPFKLVPCDNSRELTLNTDAVKSDLQYLFQ